MAGFLIEHARKARRKRGLVQQAEAEPFIEGAVPGDGPEGRERHRRKAALRRRIDRMAVTEDAVEIVDFKTNRAPPGSVDDIPFEHRAQLAIYRTILAPLYPGREIRCGLIYTEAARTYWLGADRLEASLAELASK